MSEQPEKIRKETQPDGSVCYVIPPYLSKKGVKIYGYMIVTAFVSTAIFALKDFDGVHIAVLVILAIFTMIYLNETMRMHIKVSNAGLEIKRMLGGISVLKVHIPGSDIRSFKLITIPAIDLTIKFGLKWNARTLRTIESYNNNRIFGYRISGFWNESHRSFGNLLKQKTLVAMENHRGLNYVVNDSLPVPEMEWLAGELNGSLNLDIQDDDRD
ncbi:MAG: hypothetical protein ABIH66_08125 [bacterium]